MNPLKYRPAQIAKAIAAAITAVVGLLTLVASNLTDGPFATIGQYATAVVLFLIPIVVFLQKAQPWIEMLQNVVPGFGDGEGDSGVDMADTR